jgi:hypothetical protein
MLGKRKPVPLSNVVPALGARTQFGRILKLVERERRPFVVEKRGSPKAIILSVAQALPFSPWRGPRSAVWRNACLSAI